LHTGECTAGENVVDGRAVYIGAGVIGGPTVGIGVANIGLVVRANVLAAVVGHADAAGAGVEASTIYGEGDGEFTS
jgi:hypothetical protein